MKKALSTLFIITGIIFISAPYINNRIIESRVNISKEVIEEVTAEEIEENTQTTEDTVFDYEAIRDVEITSTITNALKTKRNY